MAGKHYANYRIHPQLEKSLCKLSENEFRKLEESIGRDGLLTPMLVCTIDGSDDYWLLDGHNRNKIVRKLGIAPEVNPDREPLHFESVEAACNWIIDNQLARRNLTKEQYMLLLGKRFNNVKQQKGGDRKSKKSKAQNEPFAESGQTADRVAAQQGVSRETVKRAGEKAKKLEETGLDALIQDGTIKAIENAALDEIAQKIEEAPEQKQNIIENVVKEAEAANGKVTLGKPKKPKSQKAALSPALELITPDLTGGSSSQPSRISHIDEIPPEDTDERDTYECAMQQLRHQIFCCRSRLTPLQLETVKRKNLEFYTCDFDAIAFEESNS